MYPNPKELARYASQKQTRPYIMCEYSHAMGNSSGGMWAYWEQIYRLPYLQGGFIWDWVDQGQRKPIPGGKVSPVTGKNWFYAYGGDFGPAGTPSDDNFVDNGLVGPDRQLHPGLLEVKHIYQYIRCQLTDPATKTLEIKNWFDFIEVDRIAAGSWRLKEDGVVLQSGDLGALDIAPRATKSVKVPVKTYTPKPGREYHLEVSFRLKADTAWGKQGHEIAWDEFKLPASAPAAGIGKLAALKLTQSGNQIRISGKDFEAVVSRDSGSLTSWKSKGAELIGSPLRPDFWRAPTDNDRGRDMAKSQGIWRHAHEGAVVKEVTVNDRSVSGEAIVLVSMELPKVGATWDTTYRFLGSGDLVVNAHFKPGDKKQPFMVRMGMQMTLPAGFEKITWLGPGPQETYTDRKDARVGVYSGTVRDQFYFDYSEPGESGNKVDVRWALLSRRQGPGLLISGLPLVSINALHHTSDDLQNAKHSFELPDRKEVTLNIDLRQQGAGGDDSWGAWPHQEFLIPCAEMSYQFRLRPMNSSDDPEKLGRLVF
jgi:beta-galactosidase